MPKITSQILKTQKSRYPENETLFFLQIKKFINCAARATLWQKKKKSFVVEETFKRGTNAIFILRQFQEK